MVTAILNFDVLGEGNISGQTVSIEQDGLTKAFDVVSHYRKITKLIEPNTFSPTECFIDITVKNSELDQIGMNETFVDLKADDGSVQSNVPYTKLSIHRV